MKEVMRVARAKRSFSKNKVSIPRRRALRLEPAWHWRLGSALMVLTLASILTPKSDAVAATTAGLKTPAKPKLNVVVIGDFYSYGYATSSKATLRKSVPPTLQVLNQVQATDNGVQVNVLFIPVAAATNSSLLHPGNQAKLPALVNAVTHSSVVIVGIGGGNAALAGPMRSVLFGTAAPKAFPQLMTSFDDGHYLSAQTALLDAIAAHAAPGTSIVTLGYPTILGKQLPSGFTWWSPYTWSTVNQQQANMSDQLVSALDTANEQATSIAAAAHPSLHFLYTDLSNAMQEIETSGSQQGQGGPAQTIIDNDLLPYISQAVNNELVTMNVHGTQDIPPATSVPHWKLDVALPVPTHTTPWHTSPAGTPPPQNNQDNPARPVYQPPAWPGLSPSPSPHAAESRAPDGPLGPLGPAGGGSTDPLLPLLPSLFPPASPSEGATPAAQGSGSEHGRRGKHRRHSSLPTDSGSGQPTGTSDPTPQPTGTSEQTPTGQATPQPTVGSRPQPTSQPQPQPTVPGSPSASSSPSVPSSPSAAGASPGFSWFSPSNSTATATAGQTTAATPSPASSPPATASPVLTPTWATGGNSSSPSPTTPTTPPSPNRPTTLPAIPAPPAPLPDPVTPVFYAPGSGTDPSSTGGAATSSTVTPPGAAS